MENPGKKLIKITRNCSVQRESLLTFGCISFIYVYIRNRIRLHRSFVGP